MKKLTKEQKQKYIITFICMASMIIMTQLFVHMQKVNKLDFVKIGIIYIGDSCNAYTINFMRGQQAIELEYGDRVEVVAKYNVGEGDEERSLLELIDEGCNIIFTTSYGYGETAKMLAEQYPDIQFCLATCDNANTDPKLPNLHNFMGEIYEGRYISGVVAGMKMKEMIDRGVITPEQAKIGYVAAFPYAEVISGYTAFLLGAKSVVPESYMSVIYTDSWGEYSLEKDVAERLIDEGCVIISQHSDTIGPAVACENARKYKEVYHVGYNQSMADIAPTSSLISCRINWQYYMVQATGAVLNGNDIESAVKGRVFGNDVSGGFKYEWVQMLKLNETIAAPGTAKVIEDLVDDFKAGRIDVFKGDYIGVDPFDSSDTYDLSNGYIENEKSSAPTFHYVITDAITIEE